MVAIVDERIPKVAAKRLFHYGYDILPLPAFNLLQQPISAHPDMLIFAFGHKLFVHSIYYKDAKASIDKICDSCGFELILSNEEISNRYPNDVLFNAILAGDRLIGKLDFISAHIKKLATESGVRLINVRQGYAKCSVCVVSDNAFITADNGIANALKDEKGLNLLKITSGQVGLTGYDNGFIGGASGSDDNNVYFCGDLRYHRDGEAIKEFCKNNGKNVVSLTDEPLYDVGTIMLFKKA